MPSLVYFPSLDSVSHALFHVTTDAFVVNYRNATLRFRRAGNHLHFAYFGQKITPLDALQRIKEEASRAAFPLQYITTGILFYIEDVSIMPSPAQCGCETIIAPPEVGNTQDEDVSAAHTNETKKRKAPSSSSSCGSVTVRGNGNVTAMGGGHAHISSVAVQSSQQSSSRTRGTAKQNSFIDIAVGSDSSSGPCCK